MIFVAGASIGALVTKNYIEKKYELLDLNKYYVDSYEYVDEPDEPDEPEECDEQPNIIEYASRLQKEGYTNYSNSEKEEKPIKYKPYVIKPEEFGDYDEYGKYSLTYYADGILTDDNDDVIDDIENKVGLDSLNRFGEYEDDAVYVRNDKLKCDYEILLDLDNYSDIAKRKPHDVR